MRYFLNGKPVNGLEAACYFMDCGLEAGAEREEIARIWVLCKTSESTRDEYFPPELEIIA